MPEPTLTERALKLPAAESFHRREWVVQRIGWGFMIVLVLAAGLGLLGRGPLSSARVGDELLLVQYQRFCRLETADEVRILVGGAAAEGRSVEIWIARGLLERGQIEQITPQPAQVRSEADRLVFRFDIGEGAPAAVTLRMRSQHIGRTSGGIGVDGGPSVSLAQFTYP